MAQFPCLIEDTVLDTVYISYLQHHGHNHVELSKIVDLMMDNDDDDEDDHL